jgi:hypothetical protein
MEGYLARAIARVCQDLGLPVGNAYSQDWAYALPETFRTQEFFERYLTAYSKADYGPDEKHVLMQLALDVANDLLERKAGLENKAWEKLAALLETDHRLHWELIEHWALLGEPLEETFPLTPRMRAVREKLADQ